MFGYRACPVESSPWSKYRRVRSTAVRRGVVFAHEGEEEQRASEQQARARLARDELDDGPHPALPPCPAPLHGVLYFVRLVPPRPPARRPRVPLPQPRVEAADIWGATRFTGGASRHGKSGASECAQPLTAAPAWSMHSKSADRAAPQPPSTPSASASRPAYRL